MVILSIAVGSVFGIAWGILFSDRCKRYNSCSITTEQTKSSAWILASTSIIRYLLLAALLVVLIVKYNIELQWWAAGFIVTFWVFLMQSVGKK